MRSESRSVSAKKNANKGQFVRGLFSFSKVIDITFHILKGSKTVAFGEIENEGCVNLSLNSPECLEQRFLFLKKGTTPRYFEQQRRC